MARYEIRGILKVKCSQNINGGYYFENVNQSTTLDYKGDDYPPEYVVKAELMAAFRSDEWSSGTPVEVTITNIYKQPSRW